MPARLVMTLVAVAVVALLVTVALASQIGTGPMPAPPPPGPPLPGPLSTWRNIGGGPSPSSGATMMTYDASLHEIVLIDTGSTCNGSYVWVYQPTGWINLSASGVLGPAPARSYGGFVYDATLGADLLFGGVSLCGVNTLNDTWTYSAGTWTRLHPATSPPPLSHFAIVYDAVDGYALLVGGEYSNGQVSRETWAFESGDWVNLTQPTSPLVDEDSAMAYDASIGAVVFVGGYSNGFVSQATWTFRAGTWDRLYPTPSPSNRAGFGLAFDQALGQVVLVGGYSKVSSGVWQNLTDTWLYGNGRWTNISSSQSIAPPAWAGPPMMAYDANTSQIVLFAGYAQTWVLD